MKETAPFKGAIRR